MSPVLLLWRMTLHHRNLVPVVCGIIMLFSALALIIPLYTKFVLEYIIPENASEMLTYSFAVFLLVIVIRFLLALIQDLAVVVLRQKIEETYNKQYINSMFQLRISALQKYDKGDLIARFRVFISEIEWFLCDFLFFVFYALFVFIFLSVAMAAINLPIFLIVLAFIPLHYYNFKHFISPLKKASEHQEEARSELTSFSFQSIDSWNDIRNYFLQKQFIQKHKYLVSQFGMGIFFRKKSGLQQEHIQAALILVNHVTIIAFGGYQVAIGEANVGTVFFFLLLLDFFYSPIYRFSAVNESLQAAGIKIQRIAEIINHTEIEQCHSSTDAPQEKVDISDTASMTVTSMELKNLSHSRLFQSINYIFYPGNIYFISGPSGCGKSTLLSLITRLSKIDCGEIVLNGESTDQWTEYKVRQYIQCALQENQLFASTIAQNIHLGKQDNQDNTKLKAAAYQAVVDDMIDELPYQYETLLTEQGENFSGGQMQRLNLARLFYHDAPIMLFDEPTSALDAHTEECFFERLQKIKSNKIIIVVNHRQHNIKHADYSLILDSNGLTDIDSSPK